MIGGVRTLWGMLQVFLDGYRYVDSEKGLGENRFTASTFL